MSASSNRGKSLEKIGPVQLGTPGNDHLRGSFADDLVQGFEGNDHLRGGGGNDWLIGGAGHDRLWGGAGNDILQGHARAEYEPTRQVNVMRGGTGDDAYIVQSPRDRVIEKAGEGIDTVHTTIGYTLPDNVENLFAFYGFQFDSNPLVGNALDNKITGAPLSYDTILGLDGNDTLTSGGRGGAFLDGGNGDDVLIQSIGESLGGAGADLFVAVGVGAHTHPNTPMNVLDFNAGEGDRIHIRSHQAYDSVALFESGQLRFEEATSLLIFNTEPVLNPVIADQVVYLAGVQAFDPAWVTVGLFA